MQDRIIIDFNALNRISSKLRKASREMDDAMDSLSGLYPTKAAGADLQLYGCGCTLSTIHAGVSAANVSSAISNYRSAIRRLSDYSDSLAAAVSDLADDYRKMEKSIAGDVGALPQNTEDAASDEAGSFGVPQSFPWLYWAPLPLVNLLGPITLFNNTTNNHSNWTSTGSYSLLNLLNANGTLSRNNLTTTHGGSADWDIVNGNIGISGNAGMDYSFFQGSGEASLGEYLIANGAFSFLNFHADASGSAQIMNDGNFEPGVQFELGAGGSVLHAEGGIQTGTDTLNQHMSAEGDLLGGDLGASGGVGVITTKDGKKEFGAKVSADAEVYVAKGEVTSGYTIFGIDIDVTASGKLLAAGVTGDASITTNGASCSFGASALIGGELSVSVDWSDFELPDFSSIDFPDLSDFKFW